MLIGQFHYLCRASHRTSATFKAIWMEITLSLSLRFVGSELHWTNTSTTFTLHLTTAGYTNTLESLRKRFLARSHPTRDTTHRTETAPCARGIDKGENYTHYRRHENDNPEDTAYISPTVCEAQLNAEHGENK